MNRFPRRPELIEQSSQRSLDFVKRKQPQSAGLQSPERQQNQQWFVRRAFLPAAPDIQVAELFEDRVSLRHWHEKSIRRLKLAKDVHRCIERHFPERGSVVDIADTRRSRALTGVHVHHEATAPTTNIISSIPRRGRGRPVGILTGCCAIFLKADGVSGIQTFIVNHEGLVYGKGLGTNTSALARQMTRFNPDKSWKRIDLE